MNFSKLLFNTPAEASQTCIGILGGGGKTTLLHTLGDELAKYHAPVILSSLTKAGICKSHPIHFYQDFESEIREISPVPSMENDEKKPIPLFKNNPVYLMKDIEHAEKFIGVNKDELKNLYQASELTIFECDGAREKPIKAHQPFDPMIPDFATHVIIVVGADAVGAKVDGKLVHRPELFRELWDVNANYQLEPLFIAKVLTSQYGYMQKVPSGIPLSYFVNKSDVWPEQALKLAQAITLITSAPVFYGSLNRGILESVS